MKSVYKHYTVDEMKVTERLIARHALTNTVGDTDRRLNAKATR